MANTPKKVKDPTEVALSAIQEALNIGESSAAEGNRGSVRSETTSAGPAAAAPFDEPTFDARPGNERQIFNPVEEPRVKRRAANDDRETIGQILQAIQKGRPARNAYTLATLATGMWIIAAIFLTVSFWPSLQASMGQGPGGVLVLAGLVALISAPVLMFFFLANLSWRGQQMQTIAQSMAQVAIRFSEP